MLAVALLLTLPMTAFGFGSTLPSLHGRWEAKGADGFRVGRKGAGLQSWSLDIHEESTEADKLTSLRGWRCKDIEAEEKCQPFMGVFHQETGELRLVESQSNGKNGQFLDAKLQGATLRVWKIRTHDHAGMGLSVGHYKLLRVAEKPTKTIPDWSQMNALVGPWGDIAEVHM